MLHFCSSFLKIISKWSLSPPMLYQVHKTSTFVRSKRGYGRQSYPKFIGKTDSQT